MSERWRPPRTRTYLDQLLRLSLNEIHRHLIPGNVFRVAWTRNHQELGDVAIAVDTDMLYLEYAATEQGETEEVSTAIPLVSIKGHYGNRRLWCCPQCQRQAIHLYLWKRQFVCRPCTGCFYRSQSTAKPDRLIKTYQRMLRKIDPDVNVSLRIPERPFLMRRKVYARLFVKALAAQAAVNEVLEAQAAKVFAVPT